MSVCMCMCVFRFFFDITEATEDKVHLGPPRDRGENYLNGSGILILILSGAFSGDFMGILPQIWPGSAGLLAGLCKSKS